MDNEEQYKRLAALEIAITKQRYTTFTALLSISFLLPGLALRGDPGSVAIVGQDISLSRLVFFLGYIFYLFAVFHYAWHHRYSHCYRQALKQMEWEMGIMIYRLRQRPRLGPFKFHYDWALYVIGVVYGYIIARHVGLQFFGIGISAILGLYAFLFLISYWQDIEPLEKQTRSSPEQDRKP